MAGMAKKPATPKKPTPPFKASGGKAPAKKVPGFKAGGMAGKKKC